MNRIEQIEKEIESLEKQLSEKDQEFMDTTNSYEAYSKKRAPYTEKIARLDRELRLLLTPEFKRSVEKHDDVMSLESFVECVNSGGFIDYDGFGNYVKDGKISNIEIYPSDVKHNSLRKDFDTIVWYNR
jgi:hypothetical protein